MSKDNYLVSLNNIQQKIFTMRGLQVMLDSDLAEIYGVETKQLNRAVKRNSKRFPERFCFQLNEKELKNLRCQAGTSRQKHGGRRYYPYVFTEQGVAMLSAMLNSEVAVEASITIINAFVEMRRFMQSNALLFKRLESVERKQLEADHKFEKVFKALESPEHIPQQGIFYDGQVFDAHRFVSDLIRKVKRKIVLVDNYIDDSVLALLGKRKKNVTVTVYTKSMSKQLALDAKKYNEQYAPIDVKVFKQAHDRFLIIDKTEIYHIGASLKDLGKKWFAFSKFERGAVEMLKKLQDV